MAFTSSFAGVKELVTRDHLRNKNAREGKYATPTMPSSALLALVEICWKDLLLKRENLVGEIVF